MRRVLDEIDRLEPAHAADAPVPPPACRYLDDALGAARSVGGPVAATADAIDAVAGAIAWTTRGDTADASPGFAAGHADARLLRATAGGRSVVGLSLLAPNVRYPDHDHPPEEVYVVLGGGEWRHAGIDWHRPGAGGVVHTPPGTVHAMRSLDDPLLAVWFQVDASRARSR